MKRLTQALGVVVAGWLFVGCVVDEPTGSRVAPPEPAVGLQMTDTLAAAAPRVSLTGTWAVTQVNRNGDVFWGTLSFSQVGRLVVGRADWANHPDGHLLGYVIADNVVFGQGFTDTSKSNLVGLYTAQANASGDSLIAGLTVSSEQDSGRWFAVRLTHCPAQQLTHTPLPCQEVVDTTSHIVDSTPVPDPRPVPDSSLFPAGCWMVNQINASGASYRGTFYLYVEGDTVTGTALWTGHPNGTLAGSVTVTTPPTMIYPPSPSRYDVTFIQSFTGSKIHLKGHYEGTLLADGSFSGSTYATEGGVPTGDTAVWTATRTSCLGAP